MHIYLQIYIHTHKYTPVLDSSSTTKEQGTSLFHLPVSKQLNWSLFPHPVPKMLRVDFLHQKEKRVFNSRPPYSMEKFQREACHRAKWKLLTKSKDAGSGLSICPHSSLAQIIRDWLRPFVLNCGNEREESVLAFLFPQGIGSVANP